MNKYYIRSAYYMMMTGDQSYLYLNDKHQWTLDYSQVKLFDNVKQAEEVVKANPRICEIGIAIVEEG